MVLSRIHKFFTFSDRVKDWAANAVIAVVIAGLLVGFTLFGVQLAQNGALTQKSINSSNVHHAETSAQEKEIQKLLAQIVALQNQHSSDITQTAKLVQEISTEQQQLNAAETTITADGNYIVAWQTWAANIIGPLCAVTNPNTSAANCPPPPAPPA